MSLAPAASALAQDVLAVLLAAQEEIQAIEALLKDLTGSQPPVTTPPVTTPPVTAPPVTTPPVTTPPVATPPVTIPPITTPPVTMPPVTTPPASTAPTSSSSGDDAQSGQAAKIVLPAALQASINAIVAQTAPVAVVPAAPIVQTQTVIAATQQKTAVATEVSEQRTSLQDQVERAVLAGV